jgi:hypothetical protein
MATARELGWRFSVISRRGLRILCLPDNREAGGRIKNIIFADENYVMVSIFEGVR